MFVNGIAFLVTISRHIKFGMAEMLKNQKSSTIFVALKHVLDTFKTKGFTVHTVLGDGQFASLQNGLASVRVVLNVTSREEHVPEIERHIRTIKERTRAQYATLPFKALPPQLVIGMVYASVFWLNAFPVSSGISKTVSP